MLPEVASPHAVRPPGSASRALSGHPIGVALTTAERELFFPSSAVTSLPAESLWLEEREIAADQWETTLRRVAPAVLVTGWRTPALPVAWLEEPGCPLHYVCHVTGSVRKLVPRSFLTRGGVVTNWGALACPQVAEHALLLALSALRNQGRWRKFIALPPGERRLAHLATRSLHGRRVGVHGFGGVARALLPLLQPFHAPVSVFAEHVPDALITAAGGTPLGSLRELFTGSDVVFECEALTPATTGVVSAALLAALPDGAVFVNVGRGALVDEAALAREAEAGRIRVAVDVVHEEPVTPTTVLTRIPGAIVSPHIAGPTLDRYADCGTLAARNLHRYLAGEPVHDVVTTEIFDRTT
jgi:phosphoglycerate dehydrogenase-like enzyme